MGLRLPRWLRRNPVPQGRHVRGTAPVSVPGAASALVVAATPALLVPEQPPTVPAPEPGPWSPEPAAEVLLAPVAPVAVQAEEPTVLAGQAAPAPEPGMPATVALGFADGASVELPADDPRVTSFRAAADAVLELPRS